MKSANKRLVMCGVSHKTSTLEQREPLQINQDEVAHANAVFFGLPRVLESLILATCNRIEFYFVTDPDHEPFETVAEFYRQLRGRDIAAEGGLFMVRKGGHAAEHLFQVAAGVDSMVLGENQIQGQIKDAYSSACAVKTAGKVMHRLFHQAFRVGKEVRSDTELGKGACSVSSAAVEMLRAELDEEARPSVLFVGVNQMIALAASRLNHLHHDRLMFANRTIEKAGELAAKYNGSSHNLEEIPQLLKHADVLVTCTSAPEPIISRDVIDASIDGQRERRLIVLDLAIPRDVDYPREARPEVAIRDLEDIKTFANAHQTRREAAKPQAERIIEAKLTEFRYWWQHVKEEPLYIGKGTAIENIVAEEMSTLWPDCPVAVRNELRHITRRIIQRVAEASRYAGAEQQEKK